MDSFLGWIEEHPWLAGAIGLVGLLIILYLLGFFSSSSSSSTSNQGNSLAAAYYNAEAAQTTAGTQLQEASDYYTAQTAQDQIQANGAEAIASTQANMYTTLGQQTAGEGTAIGNDQLLATENSNDDALQASNLAGSYALQTSLAGYQAGEVNNYVNSVISPELLSASGQATGGGAFLTPFGTFNSNTGSVVGNVNDLMAEGYTQAQADQLVGF